MPGSGSQALVRDRSKQAPRRALRNPLQLQQKRVFQPEKQPSIDKSILSFCCRWPAAVGNDRPERREFAGLAKANHHHRDHDDEAWKNK